MTTNYQKIETKKELIDLLKKIPLESRDHKRKVVCSLIGCSRICTVFWGYRNCGRCGGQLGDSVGSMDWGIKQCVIIGHNCKECRKNYKECTWKDKYLVKNPFKKEKEKK